MENLDVRYSQIPGLVNKVFSPEKRIYCYMCKASTWNKDTAWVKNYYNLEERPDGGFIATGCENCKNYADIKKEENKHNDLQS